MSLPREEFFSYITGLGDDQVRYLYSIYIGEVPTPFHKPKLTRQLVHFFKKEETVQAIARLLDEEDLTVLAAAGASKPTFSRLMGLLSRRGFSPYSLQLKLINLEHRLCIYCIEDDEPRFSVNPMLADLLGSRIHPSLLAPGVPYEGVRRPFWLTPQLLACWLTLIHQHGRDFTVTGEAKKHRLGEITRIFPSIPLPAQTASEAFGVVARSLQCCKPKQDQPAVSFSNGETIFSSPAQTLVLTTAALLGLPPHYSSFNTQWPKEVLRLFRLTSRRAYTPDELETLACLSVSASDDPKGLAASLIAYGVYHDAGDGRFVLSSMDPEETGGLPIRMSSDFSIHIDARTPVSRWLVLCRFCRIRKADTMIIMEMNRETVFRGMETGLTEEMMLEAVQRCTEKPAAPSMASLVSQWASYYRAVRVYDEVVLQTDERTSRIIKGHPSLSSRITQILAPGVFLVKREEFPAFKKELVDAGVPYVPDLAPLEQDDAGLKRPLEQLSLSDAQEEGIPEPGSTENPDACIRSLMQEVPKAAAGKEMQSELTYRISQRMILSSVQLKATSRKRTMFEAGGFDYQGKLQLIKQAVSSPPAILELRLSADDHELVLVSPKQLVREGGADILHGVSIPDGTPFSRSVGKLFLIRLIKRPLHRLERGTPGW